MVYKNLSFSTATRADISLVPHSLEIAGEAKVNPIFAFRKKPDLSGTMERVIFIKATAVHSGEDFSQVIVSKLQQQVANNKFCIWGLGGNMGSPNLFAPFIADGVQRGIPTYGLIFPPRPRADSISKPLKQCRFCSLDDKQYFLLPWGVTFGRRFGLVCGKIHQNNGLIDKSLFRTCAVDQGTTKFVHETFVGQCTPVCGRRDPALTGIDAYAEFCAWTVILGCCWLD